MKHLLAFVLAAFGTALFYAVFCFFTLPFSEPWIKKMYEVKDYIASKDDGRARLLVFSGSNSLFGFSGKEMEKFDKYRFVNYAIHAALPLEHLVDKIMAVAKQGDVVLLPLEFNYYTRESLDFNPSAIHKLLDLGAYDYGRYSRLGLLESMLKYSPAQILTTTIMHAKTKFEERGDVAEKMERLWAGDLATKDGADLRDFGIFDGRHYGYRFTSSDSSGSFAFGVGELEEGATSSYIDENFEFSATFLSEFKKLESWAKNQGVRIILTYPIMGKNAKFNLSDDDLELKEKSWAKIKNLQKKLSDENITIHGAPLDFFFERKYFLDTFYHANAKGAVLRSHSTIKMLKTLGI